jgi:uncharacterized repeat protein (TIGR03803 family)
MPLPNKSQRLIGTRCHICQILFVALIPLSLCATSPVIYNFQGGTSDGANPKRSVVVGTNGTLYGTTVYGGSNGDGTVFSLVPPGTSWTETVLYSFAGGSDGSEPDGTLVVNGSSLYGTTSIGGAGMGTGYGTVFRLKYSLGTWTESVLYSFTGGSDGSNPYAGLVLDSGVLYGTTFNGGSSSDGVAFSLTPPPPGTTWTEAVLHGFTGATSDGAIPHAPLTASSSTLFYGTTYNGGNSSLCTGGCGTVFQLQQSGGVWTETVLYNFGASSGDGKNPHGGVVIDSNGVLYGTTLAGGAHGHGMVFSLTNSGGSWTRNDLYDFAGAATMAPSPAPASSSAPAACSTALRPWAGDQPTAQAAAVPCIR